MSDHGEEFDPEYDYNSGKLSSVSLSPLPQLFPSTTVHPGCCVALSSHLLSNLSVLLPQSPSLVLSIGSGSGLLEALLRTEPQNINVVGVEVQPSINRYLPTAHHRVVAGTYSLEPLAVESTAWLFVYPRRVGLVQAYMSTYGNGAMNMIVWIGPTADWADYKICFGDDWNLQVQIASDLGGRAFEMVVVASKKPN